jgi:hypothetical protein
MTKSTENYSLDGVTLNRFFGVDINDEDSRKKFDHSEYDVIVFDEIYLAVHSHGWQK